MTSASRKAVIARRGDAITNIGPSPQVATIPDKYANPRGYGTIQSGAVYLSSTGLIWEEPEITTAMLKEYSKNVYGAKITLNQKSLIFGEKYTITVYKPDETIDEDIQNHLYWMFDQNSVKLWTKMQMGWKDRFWYGASFENPVWGMVGNEYRLLKLRHLPAHTFGKRGRNAVKIYSEILQGVTINEQTGDIEIYQTDDDGEVIKLENIYLIKNTDSAEIAGEPIVRPIVPIITLLKFAWNAQMQKVNRVGAPLLFLRVTQPKGDDIEYGQKLLKNWGKDTSYQLRSNMELINPGIQDTATALETIQALERLCGDYFNPTSFITKEGTLIGGSSAPEQQMMQAYIRGIHSELEEAYTSLAQEWLDENGFVGYHAEINIPEQGIDKTQNNLLKVDKGIVGKYMFINEMRELSDLEPLDDEGIVSLLAEQKALSSLAPQQFPGANQGMFALAPGGMEGLDDSGIPVPPWLQSEGTGEPLLPPPPFSSQEGEKASPNAEPIVSKEDIPLNKHVPKHVRKATRAYQTRTRTDLTNALDIAAERIIRALEAE